MKQGGNVRTTRIARLLVGYLLLLYTVMLPGHRYAHASPDGSVPTEHDENLPPVDTDCLVCHWWSHQGTEEAVVLLTGLRSEFPFFYYLPEDTLPPVALIISGPSRAPPACG